VIAGFPVLVVDDHQLFAAALAIALQARGLDAHVCPTAQPLGVLAEAGARSPGLVLLDLNLGLDEEGRRIDGTELIGRLTEDGWTVVVLTGYQHAERHAAAALAGAVSVVDKSAPLPTLVELVETIAAGRQPMTPQERRTWLAEQRRLHAALERRAERLARLSPREREVLQALAEGRRAGAIAQAGGVSVATVRSQIRSVLGKLEVGSQLEAVALVREAEARARG
jgi:DNA-binding NarL/FixJ family response regulator